ncbi:probable DNA double-strand break repair Rad50 ATPase isoform X2 [Ruditapes philippinarum]|uniref:probable DNA double-strand break repair Rad50 ATPase isoform X2 n=1 Tax=Ruditapes philippinarum TaxID=129788 RepID=UPI00295BB7DB|nr:probable DNA double-strand break repair Rad50 ATPase isoform X2 [Ruditapes philippinarum]
MDRLRRRESVDTSDNRKRGKLPSVTEKTSEHENGSLKFKGSVIAPEVERTRHGLGIDPNLLVGPIYEPQTTESDRIKEQLGDITEKLHKTLHSFDEFKDFEHEDPVVSMMRKQIGKVDDKDMRSNLATFIDQYEDMSCQVTAANQDRDDMLMQLADWFTTDHVDLDDIKSAVDDSEEEFMKQSYFSTMTNFEKLKKLQNQITSTGKEGRPTKQLQQKKLELEKNVVDNFKVMKDMSMQTAKLKVADDAPWKYAANEICAMLKNVRTENAEEMQHISKKMQEMVDSLDKQAKTIKSLTAAVRDKKEIILRLTDENCDLSEDLTLLRNRYSKYEKDLQEAQKLIRQLHAQKVEDGKAAADSAQGKAVAESVSKMLSLQMSEQDQKSKATSKQLREYKKALESIRSDYSRAVEDFKELKIELEEKRAYISSIETENEKLSKDVKKLKQERKKAIAAGFVQPAAGDGHKCEHCKCHVTENEFEEEIESLKKVVTKWQEKCKYFKKCLADTELKLSEAFREISDLRMDREPPSPTSVQKSETQAPVAQKTSDEHQEMVSTQQKDTSAVPKPKPKKEIRARYLEKSHTRTQSAESEAFPVSDQIYDKIAEWFPNLNQRQARELQLYKSGDLQGKLNLLTAEITDFVSDIGKMLYLEKEDEGKTMQTPKYFNSQVAAKKQKDAKDFKDEQAKQSKNSVLFNGQQACAKLREAFDILSAALKLQHNEYEAMYRSFKISQQRNHIRREIFMGRLPVSTLREFDRIQRKKMQESDVADSLLHAYFNISYGGGAGVNTFGMRHNQAGNQYYRGNSSEMSIHSDTIEESEAKLKNTMHMLRVQRSKSDLDARETPNSFSNMGVIGGMGGMMKERSHVYMPTSSEILSRESLTGSQKQEMKVGLAVLNKKGLISLTTNDVSNQLPELTATVESRRPREEHHSGKQQSKSLIKRKDLMDHYKAGFKILADEEIQKNQEEELEKSLGDYTILDLQSKLLDFTDAKSPRRSAHVDSLITQAAQKKVPQQMKSEKSVTLPAIKTFNPF